MGVSEQFDLGHIPEPLPKAGGIREIARPTPPVRSGLAFGQVMLAGSPEGERSFARPRTQAPVYSSRTSMIASPLPGKIVFKAMPACGELMTGRTYWL